MTVLVEYREQPGDSTVKAAAYDRHPEGRDECRYEFDVPDDIDHHEEDRERDRCTDHKTDPERFAEPGRFGTVFGVFGSLIKAGVIHLPDIRHIRTPVGAASTDD